jgi:hypothetical protein
MLLMLVRYRLAVTVAPRQDHDGAFGTSLSSYDWQSAIGSIETDLLVQQPLGNEIPVGLCGRKAGACVS